MCAAVMGGGFIFAKKLGIDDLIIGLWVGGFILAISMWLSKKAIKAGIKNKLVSIAVYTVPCIITLSMIIFIPGLFEFGNILFGIEKLYLGIIIGGLVFWLSKLTDTALMKSNKGLVLFPLQSIVLSLSFIALVSLFIHFVFFVK